MQTKEDSLLTLLEDAGLLTRSQIEAAALKAVGDSNVIDLLIQEGVLSDVEVSRARAAQTQMEWLDRELARSRLTNEDVTILMHHDPRGGHNGKDLCY